MVAIIVPNVLSSLIDGNDSNDVVNCDKDDNGNGSDWDDTRTRTMMLTFVAIRLTICVLAIVSSVVLILFWNETMSVEQ
jgi:hypothetical protein